MQSNKESNQKMDTLGARSNARISGSRGEDDCLNWKTPLEVRQSTWR